MKFVLSVYGRAYSGEQGLKTEATGRWRTLYNEEFHDLQLSPNPYCQSNQNKNEQTGEKCGSGSGRTDILQT
jgi:hypothetical protein